MTSRGAGARSWQVLVPALIALALAGGVRAEGVEKREKVASSPARLRGAVGLRVIPGGYLALGGSKLRYMAKGAKEWRTLHAVPGDSLYRVDADERGRLLAVWEKEPVIHVFGLRDGAHRTVPKPPAPPGYDTPFSVDGLHLVDGGRAAIVFVTGHPWAYDTGTRRVVAAYRVPLDGDAPELLFSEEGHTVHSSSRGTAIVKPKDWKLGCSFSGCPVDSILALEFAGSRVSRRTIFVARDERVDTAQNVRSWYEDRFAVQLGSWDGKRHRKLLRYTYGKEPSVHELSEVSLADFEMALLARDGEYVEARQDSDRTVTVTRVDLAGEESSVKVSPWADARGRPVKDWFQSLGERSGGGLWLLWGDSLVVGDLGAPRRLDIGEHVGRGTEWANAFVYEQDPESLWVGIEVGGGRDYVRLDLADVDRRARPWQRPTVSLDARSPMPPSVASRLSGSRRERAVGGGVVSIGQTDLYYREDAREDWRLLYAVPDRSIYRMQIDEQGGRILAHWSSERTFHLFVPGQGVHRTFPWPGWDAGRSSFGLTQLFFSTDRAFALVYMAAYGKHPWINEAYRVPLDAAGEPRLLFSAEGNYLDLSERGATFVLPTQQSGYRCDTVYCIVDRIVAVSVDGDAASERVVYRQELYTDFARRVPGAAGDERAVVIRRSVPREEWQTRGRSERVLLRFRYGAPGVETTPLPPWTTDAVKRTHLTDSGDYLEFVVTEKEELVIEILRKNGKRSTWRVPSLGRGERDGVADRGVHGFGERARGGYWLHWGDHVLLLREGRPPLAFSVARYMKPRGEWAGADAYTASPESLRLGVDVGAGRQFADVGFGAIEKGARELR